MEKDMATDVCQCLPIFTRDGKFESKKSREKANARLWELEEVILDRVEKIQQLAQDEWVHFALS